MQLIEQRRDFDCGIACLKMLTRLPYEDIYVTALKVVPGEKMRRVGIQGYELQKIAKLLGRDLRYVHHRKVDLEESIGILGVNYDFQKVGHWVLLHNGTLIDPTGGEVWTAEDYFTENKGTRHGGLWAY